MNIFRMSIVFFFFTAASISSRSAYNGFRIWKIPPLIARCEARGARIGYISMYMISIVALFEID